MYHESRTYSHGCTELCERISKCLINAFRKIKRGAHRYGDVLREILLTSIVAIFFKDSEKLTN